MSQRCLPAFLSDVGVTDGAQKGAFTRDGNLGKTSPTRRDFSISGSLWCRGDHRPIGMGPPCDSRISTICYFIWNVKISIAFASDGTWGRLSRIMGGSSSARYCARG
jgi:hypothetical protein